LQLIKRHFKKIKKYPIESNELRFSLGDDSLYFCDNTLSISPPHLYNKQLLHFCHDDRIDETVLILIQFNILNCKEESLVPETKPWVNKELFIIRLEIKTWTRSF